VRFVVGAGTMKALLALGILGLVPWLGYDVNVARAAAFHFMAIGQLVLTYASRHTTVHPLSNRYLHGAVAVGILIQLAAAAVPLTSDLLGDAGVPPELWLLIFGAAGIAWVLAEATARLAWRRYGLA
jgi:Ca2+-transporting ATPase